MTNKFVPPQHGAWAMLTVPYFAGLLVAGWSWVAAPLGIAWLAGYLLSYYVFLAIKTGRPGRWRAQLVVYSALAVPLVSVVVWARPSVLWYATAFAALSAVNAWYARRRRERALLNDLASVVQSCLMVLVVTTVAQAPLADSAGAFAVCLAYFAGTTFYVKTMIRERSNVTYRRWSIGYHAAALAVVAVATTAMAGWLGLVWVAVFGWFLVRAWLLPGRGLPPKQVGFIEIGNCVLLLAAIWLTWG
ncbi:MAG TPA: YwiC-like family protein [Jiangellaceae bacterium]